VAVRLSFLNSKTAEWDILATQYARSAIPSLQPTRLIQPLCMSLSQGIACCKWWNSDLIISWTLLILFVLFYDCWNLQIVEGMDAALKTVFTTNFGIT
jgi:hypothetical protein